VSRDNGSRAAREFVALHAELGVKAERVPLSGAARYQGYAFGPDAPSARMRGESAEKRRGICHA
jgi:hypothetical protein